MTYENEGIKGVRKTHPNADTKLNANEGKKKLSEDRASEKISYLHDCNLVLLQALLLLLLA